MNLTTSAFFVIFVTQADMRAFRKTVAVAALIVVAAGAMAQSPSFREPGYKGNVSYSNMMIVWNGIDTSHGYMFNEHHYIGGGAGFSSFLDGRAFPALIHLFAEYRAYWFDGSSTPVAGIRAGYIFSVPSGGAVSNLEIEPSIGWSWGLKSGNGLLLRLGIDMINAPVALTENSSLPLTLLPKLSFSFEF